MSRTQKTFAIAVCVALVAASVVSAQFMPKKIWRLTVVTNVPNAIVYVDNVQVPGNVAQVAGGAHNVKVVADGYLAFNGPVVVSRDQTFTLTLQPAGFPLTIRVNVPNAAVFIDGVAVQGPPFVAAGPHTVQVTADGYQDYTATVNVTGPLAMDVVMNPLGLPLTVNANVPGAFVTINNVNKGGVPYTEYLPPGTYLVRVSARGFADYVATISLDKPTVVNVPMQPAMRPSTLTILVPPAFLDPDVQPGDPQAGVRVFIDGRLANPGRETDRIAVVPGRHRIRIASGAFSVQMGDIDIQPGMAYMLQLGMDVKISASRAPGY